MAGVFPSTGLLVPVPPPHAAPRTPPRTARTTDGNPDDTPVYLSTRKSRGLCLRTKRRLEEGTHLCVFEGESVEIPNRKQSVADRAITHPTIFGGVCIGHDPPRSLRGIGQFAADAASIGESDLTGKTWQEAIQVVRDYDTRSCLNANARIEMIEGRMTLVAIRDFEQDDEVFVNYGYAHWLFRVQMTAENPYTRILAHVLWDNHYPFRDKPLSSVLEFPENYFMVETDEEATRFIRRGLRVHDKSDLFSAVEHLPSREKLRWLLTRALAGLGPTL